MKRWHCSQKSRQCSTAAYRASYVSISDSLQVKSRSPIVSFFLLAFPFSFSCFFLFSFFFFEKILPSRSRFSCGSLGVPCDDVARVNSAPSNIIGQPCVRRNFEECLCVRMIMVFANSQIFSNSLLKFRLLWVIL